MNKRTKDKIKRFVIISIPFIMAAVIIWSFKKRESTPSLTVTTPIIVSKANPQMMVINSSTGWNTTIRYKEGEIGDWLQISPESGQAGESIVLKLSVKTSSSKVSVAYIDIHNAYKTETRVVILDDSGKEYLKSAPRITWDASKQQYAITCDPTDAGLYFKKGGIVGLFSGPGKNANLGVPYMYGNDSSFDVARDIPFNMTNAKNWSELPIGGSSEANNHNVNNVKAGKGDPCRLVGLSLSKIKNSSVASLTLADIDNQMWRMPTDEETKIFSGYYYLKYPDNWVVNNGEHWLSKEKSPYQGVVGGEFGNKETKVFLPAAGIRFHLDGSVRDQGIDGYYWSCGERNLMSFQSNQIVPLNQGDYRLGCSIRCVRQ